PPLPLPPFPTRRSSDLAARRDLLPVEADALGEAQPQLESTLAGGVPVVIANPTDPHPPEGRILRLAEDQRVLDRHARLVVVAIQDRKSTRLNSSHLGIS